MIIGLDFDNTIVRYDRVFHDVALEKGLIDPLVPVSKVAVRDALRKAGHEDVWTEMQGYVYGCRMDSAEIFEDAVNVIRAAHDNNIQCKIISHKTQYPYMGPKYDLHAAAREWILKYLVDGGRPLIATEHVSFHETKAEKIKHISDMKCNVFFDDLPEILKDPNFSSQVKAVLFDPDQHHTSEAGLTRLASWNDFRAFLGIKNGSE